MNRMYGGAIYWQIFKLKGNYHSNRIQHVAKKRRFQGKIKRFHNCVLVVDLGMKEGQ